jgi:addiction module HigA family antidote
VGTDLEEHARLTQGPIATEKAVLQCSGALGDQAVEAPNLFDLLGPHSLTLVRDHARVKIGDVCPADLISLELQDLRAHGKSPLRSFSGLCSEAMAGHGRRAGREQKPTPAERAEFDRRLAEELAWLRSHPGSSPEVAIPPGSLLAEELEARDLSQSEIAWRMGLPLRTINSIVRGKRPITADIALNLEKALPRIAARIWLRLEADYRLSKARLAAKRTPASSARRRRNPSRG